MAEGVSTRLQKEVNQLQKDVEKVESKLVGLEAQLTGVAEKLRSNITLELKKDMEDMFAKWGTKVEHLLVSLKENISEKISPELLEVRSPAQAQKSAGDSSGSENPVKGGYGPFV